MLRNNDDNRAKPNIRRGAITVEFALVLPLLLLFTFAAVEFSRINMIVNTMENACYEAARRGIIPGGTTQTVREKANSIMRAIGAAETVVTVTPTNIVSGTTEVTVTIDLPLDQNAWVIGAFSSGKVLTRTCTLARENSGL
ncbi:MAG: pilus assembly protein [Planctomycetaceae bacterium]